jgi:phenylpyruvate tautomerase PptA (4-oxalocrotonate tautomerase family)
VLQLNLDILNEPPSDNGVWNSLNEEQRAILIDALTRLIAKTVIATPSGVTNDE